jgi:DNA invertase Pin-like site-specific DNA recombinase
MTCLSSLEKLWRLPPAKLIATANLYFEAIEQGNGGVAPFHQDCSPMSKFLLHLFAAFAEMERDIIRERVCAGVRAAKAKGTRVGHPRRVFRRDEALRLRAEGKSWRNLAKR